MYKRHESAQAKQAFWTTFGLYMSPVISSEGNKINWINYKTGVKDIFFRMDADNTVTKISIEVTHPDEKYRLLYYQHLVQLKPALHAALQEAWTWKSVAINQNGKSVCQISKEQTGLSVYKKNDWPFIISFLKPRIIALDEFWSNARYHFESG